MSLNTEAVDITPTPKILRTLGDIPFSAWQCLAELADNSLDALYEAEKNGMAIDNPRVDMHWSTDSVAADDREVIIQDNGLGMKLEDLQKAAKAGYSSNDPIHNLGLFGMGFNIATARLGDETLFLSATPDGTEWIGIKINFNQLIKEQTFSAPVIREQKKNPNESGTKIIVRGLKEGVFVEIRKKERAIRRQLETIYAPILRKGEIVMYLQGSRLSPRLHCAWSSSRFVVRKGEKIEAIQSIDRDLGETYFDSQKNRYLTQDESEDHEILASKDENLPSHIVKRARRLKGWIGIQRYADLSEFGIDFVRNGRKILVSDKSFFDYENPDTGTTVPEYPVELGSTIGGRIVGELHVDYLIPSYQKNSFDTTDKAWRLTLEAVRGGGPILPKRRKALGYDGDNESPLGKMVNAYRRVDRGTKCLFIPNEIAQRFAKNFYSGNSEYENDDKWYQAAQECDRERAEGGGNVTPVHHGDDPSDDISAYLEDSQSMPSTDSTAQQAETSLPATHSRDFLIQHSSKEESLSGKYTYNKNPALDIIAWRLRENQIKIEGSRVPYHLYQNAIDVDFFYDPMHPLFSEYPLSPKLLLLLGLAEKFSIRDTAVSIQEAFLGLVENHFQEERINPQALQEQARSIVSLIREELPSLLGHKFDKVKKVITSVEAEEEALINRLVEDAPQLLEAYQCNTGEAIGSLAFVGDTTIKRLINTFPEEFMDNNIFNRPYANLNIGSKAMRERIRKNSLENILLYFSDVVSLLQGEGNQSKQELLRYANTLSLLEDLLA